MLKYKNDFREALGSLYSVNEINSIFNMAVQHITGLSHNQILLNASLIPSPQQEAALLSILQRLCNSEPIQYIIGETEFYGLKFKVNPTVLIPRNETEELVDLIIKNHQQDAIKILDIGTGSGCIPISLKKNMPLAQIYSCDISQTAIETAVENAKLNHVGINLFKHDVLEAIKIPFAPFGIIVSNPPYVTEKEKELMHTNVLNSEPHTALFVPDNDPLLFYREIIKHAAYALNPSGCLYFEVNEAYAEQVAALLEDNSFNANIQRDLNGRNRIVVGVR